MWVIDRVERSVVTAVDTGPLPGADARRDPQHEAERQRSDGSHGERTVRDAPVQIHRGGQNRDLGRHESDDEGEEGVHLMQHTYLPVGRLVGRREGDAGGRSICRCTWRVSPPGGAMSRGDGVADTKDQIVAVAMRHFAADGYASTSLNVIADEVGIRRPSVLHHFATKEALYRAVVEDSFTDWFALVKEATGDVEPGWPQVEKVVRAAFPFFEERPEFVRLVRREAIDDGPILTMELMSGVRPLFDARARGSRPRWTPGDSAATTRPSSSSRGTARCSRISPTPR